MGSVRLNRLPRWSAAALLLALAGSPAPTPILRGEEPPHRIGSAEQVRVSLVAIDAVVRDRKDQPVRGLTREDFRLSVDGVPVPPGAIETFEESCAPLQEAAHASSSGGAGPPAAPATPAADGSPRHIVVFADFTQMSLPGRSLALRAMQQAFSGELSPDERVMILAHRRGLRLVQEFTSDASQIRARFAELYADRATIDSDVIEEASNLRELSTRINPELRQPTANLRGVGIAYMQEEAGRARRSLAYLTEMMPALAALKGRKALILLTDTLRDEPGVGYASIIQTTPQSEGIDMRDALLRLGREANAAGISIYTVHASGLEEVTGQASATNLSSALGLQTTLAAETGGRALQRTNQVDAIVRSARQDLACHYVLGYRADLTGSGRRHDLKLVLGPDRDGRSRGDLTVRHRPYYTDISSAERIDRALQSALDLPALFRSLPMSIEAFPLEPSTDGWKILIKLTLPLERLSLLPTGPRASAGRIALRGRLTQGPGTSDCPIDRDVTFPVEAPSGSGSAEAPLRLVYETGCTLRPGEYEFGIAVQDVASALVGSRRVPLRVPASLTEPAMHLTEFVLWSRDPRALVIASGADALGYPAGPVPNAYLPLAHRVLERGLDATVTFLACLPPGASPTSRHPLRIRRQMLGEEGASVADLRPLEITDPPDPRTGCYSIVSAIPAGSLGEGVYTFRVRGIGPPAGSPAIERSGEIAVR